MMKVVLLGLSLISLSASAANIYVADSGLYPQYRAQLKNSGRLLRESCYSVSRDVRRYRRTDQNNSTHKAFYEYKQASLCRNQRGEDHSSGASLLRTSGLPGALGRSTGLQDSPVKVVTDPHHNVIANVITRNTSSGVRQWHVHTEALVGRNAFGQIDWTKYNVLTQESPVIAQIAALKDLGSAITGLNGVKVVNISSIMPAIEGISKRRYKSPCDNHSDVRNSDILKRYATEIKRLRNRGVVVVAGTANTKNSRTLDNYVMPFPACLSTTVAVGGLDGAGRAQGAIDTRTDFLAPYSARDPITGGLKSGTSYAAPLVASYIAELLTINPTRTANQVLNTLRNTSDLHRGSRRYGNTTIRYSIAVPNFARAKANVIDSFWKQFVQLITNKTDEGFYGWNYGSSEHENGILSYFETVTLQQNRVSTLANKELPVAQQGTNTGQQALRFSFRAFDIDRADEVKILVNDKFYGHVKATGSNRLGGTQTICIAASDLTTNGKHNEVKLKLKTPRETWGVRNLKIERGVIDSSCQQGPPSFPPLPDNDDRLQGSNAAYGNAYIREKASSVPLVFTLGTQLKPTASSYKTNRVLRDVRLKFTTKSGTSTSTDNGTLVYVNGQRLFVTEYFSGKGERNYDFIIHRKHLKTGRNSFEFRPRDSSTQSVWGIRGISIEYIAPISLNVGSTKSGPFGYGQSPKRYTGLRANFNLPQVANDYSLSVSGWDIDVTDETQVFINGRSLGYLNTTPSNAYGSGNTFLLPRSYLVRGNNQIEFVQKYPGSSWTGFEHEKWAVKNLKIQVLKPDLKVSSVQIIDAKLKPNVPFSVKASIFNGGVGSSNTSTVRYLVSVDKRITHSDTLLGTSRLSSIAIGRSRTVSKSLTSSLVNKNRYFGVCVDVVPNEISSGNNCSSGIRLENKPIVAPMIMLLLGDE